MRFLISLFILFVVLGIPTRGNEAPDRVFVSTPQREVKESVSVLFAGDMMFDRTVRSTADAQGDDFIFSCIADELHAHDAVVSNLEGPITAHVSVSAGSQVGEPENTRFTFPLRTAELLARHNVAAVSLGNNHIFDFGEAGIRETREALRGAGVAAFGDPTDDERMAVVLDIDDVSIALVAFNEFFPTGGSASSTIAHIRELDAEMPVVVFAHWGDEYAEVVPRQRQWARQFIDAGADMVIGAHPHVVQEREFYRGVPIYYSLGNFVFDQYFSDDVRRGLLLGVSFTGDRVVHTEEIPIALMHDERPCLRVED